MPGTGRVLTAGFLFLALVPGPGGRGVEAADPGSISGLAQGVADWVVSIKVDRSKDIEIPRSQLPFNGRVSPESQSYFKRPSGQVTGLLVDRRGFILTSNYNLLGTIRSVTVLLADGRERKAKVVARDPLDDLALLRLQDEGEPVPEGKWKPPPWAKSSPGVSGRFVFAIGRGPSPRRLNVSEGIISAVGRNTKRAVQIDAKLNYGNVGGPLVDLDGKVVGLCGFVGHTYHQWGLNSGIGFATTVETIRRVLPQMMEGKDIKVPPRPFLGIQSEPGGSSNDGAPVVEVVPESSAASAGVQKKDVITRFNGQAVPNFDRLRFLIFSCKVGDKVEFVVRRDGKEISLKGVLGKFPGRR
ncbi:MAG: trypsin-like peptidase domain-containing protein [Planctomycetota bacterium]|nr:trypsin-like peptidase domain-containing protein [Planctomycetota bacterium]